MTEKPIKEDPVEKFRKLIASFIPLSRLPKKEVKMEEDQAKPAQPAARKNLLNALPRKKDAASQPKADPKPKTESTPKPASAKPAVVVTKPKAESTPETGSKSRGSFFGPRFWTIASLISLSGNVILALVLIVLLISVSRLGLSVSYLMEMGTSLVGLPGGLYTNFEKMERANIETNVVVNTTIPVKFDLQLNQQTNVVLSQDVTITNALVTVNTGGLNISRANTTIVLPQGTSLPVFLNLTVPVDQQVPVTLNVPVNIPLRETQLNEPFIGLQQVIKPLYCFLDANALNMDGQPICP